MSKKLLFPFPSLIGADCYQFHAKFVTVCKRAHVLVIFLNLQPVVFWEEGLGGKEQVEEICPIFVQEKGLCCLPIIVYKINFKLIYIKMTKRQVLLK